MRYYSKFQQAQVKFDCSLSYSSIWDSYAPSSTSADHISSCIIDQSDGRRFFLVLFDAYNIPHHHGSDRAPSYRVKELSTPIWRDIIIPRPRVASCLMFQSHILWLTSHLARRNRQPTQWGARITIPHIIISRADCSSMGTDRKGWSSYYTLL